MRKLLLLAGLMMVGCASAPQPRASLIPTPAEVKMAAEASDPYFHYGEGYYLFYPVYYLEEVPEEEGTPMEEQVELVMASKPEIKIIGEEVWTKLVSMFIELEKTKGREYTEEERITFYKVFKRTGIKRWMGALDKTIASSNNTLKR